MIRPEDPDMMAFLKYFVEEGEVDVDEKDKYKQTCIFYASRDGRNNYIQFILQHTKQSINEPDLNQ